MSRLHGWDGRQVSLQSLVLKGKINDSVIGSGGPSDRLELGGGVGSGPQSFTGPLSPGPPRRALFWGHLCPDAQMALCGRRTPTPAWCPHSCAGHCLGPVPQWTGKGLLQAGVHHLGPEGTGHQVALCPWLEDAGSLPIHQLQPPSQREQSAPPSPNPAGPAVRGSREQTHQIALDHPSSTVGRGCFLGLVKIHVTEYM